MAIDILGETPREYKIADRKVMIWPSDPDDPELVGECKPLEFDMAPDERAQLMVRETQLKGWKVEASEDPLEAIYGPVGAALLKGKKV